MPVPPRKNVATPPAQQPANEETLFEKLWNRIIAKQREVTPNNKKVQMKQFTHINSVLNVEALEAMDEGVFLNEEQLTQIEERMEANQQLVTERDNAVQERETAVNDLTAAQATLASAFDPFNAIDQSIASAETPEAKATAIRTLLAARPAAAPVVTLENGDPKTEVFDGFSKEEMELVKNL
jgi:3-methyladenine DNA glycosylase/8-oxoguanine DNA glycosylase